MNGTDRDSGFTLIELIVGIAATTILLLAIFRFATDLITLRETISRQGNKTHNKVVFNELLHQDLSSIPRGKRLFQAKRDQFTRRAVTVESENGRRMETIVRYVIRQEGDGERLYRQWRWADIQDEFRNEEQLISDKRVEIEYLDDEGQWRARPGRNRPGAIRISWSDSTISVPLASGNTNR